MPLLFGFSCPKMDGRNNTDLTTALRTQTAHSNQSADAQAKKAGASASLLTFYSRGSKVLSKGLFLSLIGSYEQAVEANTAMVEVHRKMALPLRARASPTRGSQ